jgi:hypothetical protein
MSKIEVGKGWEGKERKKVSWHFRLFVEDVMTCAHFGVDILRDVGSCGGTNLVFPLYSVVGSYNCSTNVLL